MLIDKIRRPKYLSGGYPRGMAYPSPSETLEIPRRVVLTILKWVPAGNSGFGLVRDTQCYKSLIRKCPYKYFNFS